MSSTVTADLIAINARQKTYRITDDSGAVSYVTYCMACGHETASETVAERTCAPLRSHWLKTH